MYCLLFFNHAYHITGSFTIPTSIFNGVNSTSSSVTASLRLGRR